MGRVSDNAKERIRERIDMVQLVSEYVNLTQRGAADFWGRCPFHDEKSASFHVLPDRGLFKCFGCGKGGDVFRFVEEIEGIGFRDALQRLAQRAGVPLDTAESPAERARAERRAALLRANTLVAELFAGILESDSPEGERGRAYLAERGINPETAQAFGLGVAPDRWDTLPQLARERGIPIDALLELGLVRESQKSGGRPYDFFRGRLMFPIRNEQGQVRAFGGRTLIDDDRKYMNSPELQGIYEKRKLLYGLDSAKKARAKRLVVVEGYMDVVMPHQVGRTGFVATLGTALTLDQARLARRYVDEVVLLFDADEAGQRASLKALANLVGLEGLTIKVARLPQGMDPDDAARKDPELLDRTLDQADDLITFIMDQALSDTQMTSPAGQERAIRAAIRLLARIPDRIRLFRELKLVAGRFGLPEDVLREELSREEVNARQGGTKKRPGSERVAPQGSGPVAELELHLLEAMLACPGSVAGVAQEGGGPQAFSPGPGQRVAGAIFSLAEESEPLPARVMARLEDPEARALCDRLIGRINTKKNYEQELAGFPVLFRRIREARLEEVKRRIRETQDKDIKRRLLTEHRQLLAQLQPGPITARAR